MTALYSFDVFLVKHYFIEQDAGFYAAASLLGKIIFFASLSIAMVMFPKVSEAYDRKSVKDVKRILNTSLIIIFLMSVGGIGFYFLFPEFVVSVLFGAGFLSITNILWPFAVVYGMFSLIYSLSMYNLSIHRYSFIYFIFIMNVIEIILIVLYHDSLKMVLSMVSVVLLILLFFLLIYTYRHNLEKSFTC